jgi:hypothetical protein
MIFDREIYPEISREISELPISPRISRILRIRISRDLSHILIGEDITSDHHNTDRTDRSLFLNHCSDLSPHFSSDLTI